MVAPLKRIAYPFMHTLPRFCCGVYATLQSVRLLFCESQFKSFSALTALDNPLYLTHNEEACCGFVQAEIGTIDAPVCLFSEGKRAAC